MNRTSSVKQLAENIFNKSKSITKGELAAYIPELAKVNPELFGVSITMIDGEQFYFGDSEHEFTLQSTSKPFIYSLALEQLGADFLLQYIGVEPTGEAFDSIIELEKNTHRPYNPMINSGAIAIANLLANHYQEKRKDELHLFLNRLADKELAINTEVYQSEKLTANRNRAIAYLLKNFNIIPFDLEEGLNLYFTQCSISANVKDLSMMAATLASGGINPNSNKRIVKANHTSKTLSLMMTCGMYDTAGEWAYSVGVPAKSGVSGAIFAAVPGVMGIAAFSPLISKNGHSFKGHEFIKNFIQAANLSIFSGKNKV